MLDLAVAYNRYRFLGDEFLTWLWFLIETDQNALRQSTRTAQHLKLATASFLKPQNQISRTHYHQGDNAGLEEGRLALRKVPLLTELSLIFKTGEHQCEFCIKGESLT